MARIYDALTNDLKRSIQYEQSKSNVLNLLTHKRQDLSVLIEVIDNERAALAHIIHANQYYIDSAEDIEEGLEAKLWQAIRENRSKLETLIAWRMIFLSAWNEVKS